MSNQAVFTVSGDSGHDYELSIGHSEDGMYFRCSCPAGQNGQLCKHRLRILQGDDSAMYYTDENTMLLLNNFRSLPEIKSILAKKYEIEQEQERLKKELNKLKKKMGRIFEHGVQEG
ncbi:MAG: hypothetical protein E7022_08200 [Desulfovibrio desulfuricans]|nr:hypothetical protein [Desulfovibrio desulfuricans]